LMRIVRVKWEGTEVRVGGKGRPGRSMNDGGGRRKKGYLVSEGRRSFSDEIRKELKRFEGRVDRQRYDYREGKNKEKREEDES